MKGATFSGPTEKGEYDAEGNACMTFDELEKWLVLLFARYHLGRALHLDEAARPCHDHVHVYLGAESST